MNSAKFYLDIINQLQDGIYFVDQERRIRFWNHAAEQITGYKAEEIVGKCCQNSGLNHVDREGRELCTLSCPLFSTLVDGKQRQDQVLVRHRDGYRIPVRVNIFPLRQGEEILGAVEVFTRDSPTVFEDSLVESLSNLAMHDELTKLPNRRYLESFLSYRFEEYQRFGRSFAVLFADIDNFSAVNNTYGHEAGDVVLKNIATSLSCSIRRNDLVGRWGGEEFLGIYSVEKASEAQIIAERFRSLVESTEAVSKGSIIRTTVSVGITIVCPEDTIQSLIDRADQLMYDSKHGGKNQVTHSYICGQQDSSHEERCPLKRTKDPEHSEY